VLEIVEGYHRSDAELPLVVVGSAPYADEYTARIENAASVDPRIRLLGGVWDQEQLDQLYANSLTYLHGHSVGGTNPSLLRAMGAAAGVLAFDVVFNREVLGIEGEYFRTIDDVSELVRKAELNAGDMLLRGLALRERARRRYRWDDVASGYEELLQRLSSGYSTHGRASGRRRTAAVPASWTRGSVGHCSSAESATRPTGTGSPVLDTFDLSRQQSRELAYMPYDDTGPADDSGERHDD
jgi:hypothetical protein